MEISADFEQVCVCVVWCVCVVKFVCVVWCGVVQCGVWERVRDTWRETEAQGVKESNLNFEIKNCSGYSVATSWIRSRSRYTKAAMATDQRAGSGTGDKIRL